MGYIITQAAIAISPAADPTATLFPPTPSDPPPDTCIRESPTLCSRCMSLLLFIVRGRPTARLPGTAGEDTVNDRSMSSNGDRELGAGKTSARRDSRSGGGRSAGADFFLV